MAYYYTFGTNVKYVWCLQEQTASFFYDCDNLMNLKYRQI